MCYFESENLSANGLSKCLHSSFFESASIELEGTGGKAYQKIKAVPAHWEGVIGDLEAGLVGVEEGR